MEKFYKIGQTILILLVVLVALSYFAYPLVGADSGYYLASAREFYAGKIYFIDIATAYNPLAILTVGLPYLFSDAPDSRFSLLINFLIIGFSAFYLFKILRTISIDQRAIVFFTLYFVFVSLLLDGSQIMLEPLSVCFQLMAFYYYLSYKSSSNYFYLVVVGLAAALSFLSKQYGLFILMPIGIDVLLGKQGIIKKVFFIGLGFVLPLLLFVVYLSHYGATFTESILYMLGKGVQFEKGNGTGINFTFFTYSLGFLFFIACNLYLLFIPGLLLQLKGNRKLLGSIYLWVLPFSFLVLFAASYAHYFQYVTPYLIIAFVYLLATTDLKSNKIKYAYVLSIFIMSGLSVYSASIKSAKFALQEETKHTLLTAIPAHSKVYLDGISPAFYSVCDFQSIDLNTVGFCFPGYFSSLTIVDKMTTGSFIVVSKEAYKSYAAVTNGFEKQEIKVANGIYYILKKV